MSTNLTPYNIALLDSSYPAKYSGLIAALQTVISNLESGVTAVLVAGLLADLSAGGHKITNLANAIASGDAVNLQTAQAILSGGGTPANIPVTSIGVGTATTKQVLQINDAGTAVIGADVPMVTAESLFMRG